MKALPLAAAALCFASAAPAHAWGRWMGDASSCPAPEKQSFMHAGKKDSPFCSPRGKCGPGRVRVELIDSTGFDFSVCVKEGTKPPPVAARVTCSAGERTAFKNPLERSGAFCAAARGKCGPGRTVGTAKDIHGLTIQMCSGGAAAAPAPGGPARQHVERITCPEPESVAQRKSSEGKVVQFCAPGAVQDSHKFSHQMSCGKGRRATSIDDYATDPAYPRSRRACKD